MSRVGKEGETEQLHRQVDPAGAVANACVHKLVLIELQCVIYALLSLGTVPLPFGCLQANSILEAVATLSA